MAKPILKKQKGMARAIPLFLLLHACSTVNNTKEGIYQNLEISYIKDVPFFSQQRYYCGPASLASVMNFYGISVSEEEIAKQVYNPKLNGALSMDMLNYARAKGLDAAYYKGSIEDIKKEISLGRPVIMFLDLGYFFYPVRHYIVAIGYDDKTGYLIAHSGAEKDKTFSYKEIHAAWERTGFGTILITPKEQ